MYLSLEILVILHSFVISTVIGQIVTPDNTAANEGTPETVLNCSYTAVPSIQFSWTFYNTSSNASDAKQIATGCSAFNTQLYGTDNSSSTSCNLNIRNAQLSQAGTYACLAGSQNPSIAQFIVLETNATCYNSANSQGGYTFSCSTSYSGNMIPLVTWYEGSLTSNIISSTTFSNNSYVVASFDVPSNSSEVPSNLCQISFNGTSSSAVGQATNAPSYTSYCNVTDFILPVPPPPGPCDCIAWIVVFSILCICAVVFVIIDFLLGFGVINCCRFCKVISPCWFYTLIGLAVTIVITGIVVGALLIADDIYTYCCDGWIGGFTIMLSITISAILIMFAFLCSEPPGTATTR